VWFSADNTALVVAQAVCLALPAAGLPARLRRVRGGGLALLPPLSIAVVVVAIALVPATADALTWVALVLVPCGCALALGWAARGARPWAAILAAPLLTLAWVDQGRTAGQVATIVLIAGSAVTVGRLLAAVVPLVLLEAGVVAMAAVDAALVFSNQLQAPNAVLVAAQPGLGLPQLQSASFGVAGLGYGDFFAAAVVGGIFAARGFSARAQVGAAGALVAASLAWDQLFLVYDVLPATVPPAVVLVGAGLLRGRARRPAATRGGQPPGRVPSVTRAVWRAPARR
jgi:hypothetical protein